MLCEKCGAQNAMGTRICKVCGQALPPSHAGTGFADILTYSPSPGSGEKMTQIEDQVESLIRTQRKIIHTQQLLIRLMAVVCVVAIVGIFFPRIEIEKATSTVFAETQAELNEQVAAWEAQIGDALSEADTKTAAMEEKLGETDTAIAEINDRIAGLESTMETLIENKVDVSDAPDAHGQSDAVDNNEAPEANTEEYDAPLLSLGFENDEPTSPRDADSEQMTNGTYDIPDK